MVNKEVATAYELIERYLFPKLRQPHGSHSIQEADVYNFSHSDLQRRITQDKSCYFFTSNTEARSNSTGRWVLQGQSEEVHNTRGEHVGTKTTYKYQADGDNQNNGFFLLKEYRPREDFRTRLNLSNNAVKYVLCDVALYRRLRIN